jgi:hypothetical protein
MPPSRSARSRTRAWVGWVSAEPGPGHREDRGRDDDRGLHRQVARAGHGNVDALGREPWQRGGEADKVAQQPVTGAASRYVASLAVTARPGVARNVGSGLDGIGLVSRSARVRVLARAFARAGDAGRDVWVLLSILAAVIRRGSDRQAAAGTPGWPAGTMRRWRHRP